MPDIEWLQPDHVADPIAGASAAAAAAAPRRASTATASGSVTLGGWPLTPGGSATVPLSERHSRFEVQVANQGENTETDVAVKVTVGQGGDAIELEETIDTIAAGETKTVEHPARGAAPDRPDVPITVDVEPVPGEKKTDNNKADFTVIFTR